MHYTRVLFSNNVVSQFHERPSIDTRVGAESYFFFFFSFFFSPFLFLFGQPTTHSGKLIFELKTRAKVSTILIALVLNEKRVPTEFNRM